MIARFLVRPIAVSAVLLFIAMLGAGLWAVANLPPGQLIASHFGSDGMANGWMTPVKALLLFPTGIVLLGAILVLVYGRINRARPIAAIGQAVDILIFAFILVLATVQIVLIANAFGMGWDRSRIMALGLGVCFLLIGNVLGKLRRNPVAGIRTPWTMADDEVWDKTHRFGGWAFVVAGLATLSTVITLHHLPFVALTLPIFAAGGLSVLRSYQLWRDLHPGESLAKTRSITATKVVFALVPVPLLIVLAQKLGWITPHLTVRLLLASVVVIVIAAAFRNVDS
jgi:uncharacterized membrane protein